MDLRVMLQDGDYDEALEMLDELVGGDEGWPLAGGEIITLNFAAERNAD